MVSNLGLRGREGATAQEGHVCGHVMVDAPWQVCFVCVCVFVGKGGVCCAFTPCTRYGHSPPTRGWMETAAGGWKH